MIYETPVFRPLGDCYLAVEFGDEADLSLNFKVLALADALAAENIKGVMELIPSFRELGILFDRFETDYATLMDAVTTPARLIALAGFSTGAYPVASPGGYQVIGRLAVNIYEPGSKSQVYPDDGVLLRAGDRLRYRNVGALEYEDIWNAAQAGTFNYRIEDEIFDVKSYLDSRQPKGAGE